MLAFIGGIPALADMGWGWGNHSWWGGGLMMFSWLLLIGVLVVLLVRAFDGRDRSAPASDAEQLLAGRYARGEIDETDYRGRLAVLKERR